jgi:hypothetical protein
MEPESPSPYPQVPATCPYPEPTPSSPHDPPPPQLRIQTSKIMPYLCTLWITVARNFRKIRKYVRKIISKENKRIFFYFIRISSYRPKFKLFIWPRIFPLLFCIPYKHHYAVECMLRPALSISIYISTPLCGEKYLGKISCSKKPKHIAQYTIRHCKVVVQTDCFSSYLFNLYITTGCHT